MRAVRSRLVVVAAAAAALMFPVTSGAAASTTTPTGTWFQYSSAPGDYVGGGVSGTITTPAATFTPSLPFATATFTISEGGQTWTLQFARAVGSRLLPGRYINANTTVPGAATVEVTGPSRGCDSYYGSFTVNTIQLFQTGQIAEADIAFVQHCGSPTAPALTGRVTYHAPKLGSITVDPVIPSTVAGEPTIFGARVNEGSAAATGAVRFYDGSRLIGTAALKTPGIALFTTSALAVGIHSVTAVYSGDGSHAPATSSATTQTVVSNANSYWFQSAVGGIGGGTQASENPVDATISFNGTLNGIGLDLHDFANDWWAINLWPRQGSLLAPGTYSNAQSIPDATHPGLDAGTNDGGCTTVTGSFRITAIATDSTGHVNKLAATFVQHCNSATAPPLDGTINIGN